MMISRRFTASETFLARAGFLRTLGCMLAFGTFVACSDTLPTDARSVEQEGADAAAEARGQRGNGNSNGSRLTAISLGDLGGGMTTALGINNRGQVVGSSHDENDVERAFVWSAREGMRALEGLSDGPSAALDINNAGDIVGWSHDHTGEQRAVRWPRGGAVEQLPHPDAGPPETPASATVVNARGDAAGVTHGQLMVAWPRGGGVERLPCTRGLPTDMNDRGTIVGIASGAVGPFPHLDDGGTVEFTGFILTPEDEACRGLIDDDFLALWATGINNRGEVVGWGGEWEPLPGSEFEIRMLRDDVPFVYTDRDGFGLDDDLPDSPRAINNRGTVVGGEFEAINDPGDRVGGATLWTTRPNAFRSRGR